jgi:hypothetical protein
MNHHHILFSGQPENTISIYLSIYVFIFLYLSISISISICIYLCIYLSTYLCIYIYRSYVSVNLSTDISIDLAIIYIYSYYKALFLQLFEQTRIIHKEASVTLQVSLRRCPQYGNKNKSTNWIQMNATPLQAKTHISTTYMPKKTWPNHNTMEST